VAAITGAVVDSGGNLADTAMTILSGQFAMVLIVDDVAALGVLEANVARAGDALGVTTSVRAIADGTEIEDRAQLAVVSVHGADRPGIVHRIARDLATLGANITDLRTHVVGIESAPVYTMVIEVQLPDSVSPEALDATVRAAGVELGVDARARAVGEDVL
jgi:glycine cleavage system transcriptional repressor